MELVIAIFVILAALFAGMGLGNASIPVDQRRGTIEQERRKGDGLFWALLVCVGGAAVLLLGGA